ncbi:uncharacterized protein LOC100367004 [Saccoglossus kowalevskii]|uniref:Uncharacterized protein LOC100367004 n=1 Tax=Saccoglossus kowalevskii TaxID=10224 RepID=A0ABM0LZE2_SACKO|nr:PREDICTED: uncharacterized protein LOC100367004 [Saccoglossus kowalevskii]
MPSSEENSQDKPKKSGRGFLRLAFAFGSTHIILGVLAVVFGLTAIAVVGGLANIGTGIWCGVFFIVTGFLGCVSGNDRNRSLIIAFMVTSIISGFCLTPILVIVTSLDVNRRHNYGIHHNCWFTVPHCSANYTNPIAIDVMLLMVALVEGIISLFSVWYCCTTLWVYRQTPKVYYATGLPSDIPQQNQIITVPEKPAQSDVFIVQPGVPGPPHLRIAQPIYQSAPMMYPYQNMYGSPTVAKLPALNQFQMIETSAPQSPNLEHHSPRFEIMEPTQAAPNIKQDQPEPHISTENEHSTTVQA